MAIAFVVTPILVRGLGNETYGIWSIVMSFTAYYALADVGLRGAATKYISQFEAVRDGQSVNKVVTTSLAVYTLLALVVLLIAAGVAVAFPLVFQTTQTSPSTLRWVVMLTGIGVSLTILSQVFSAALVATNRFDLCNVVAVSTQVLQAVLIVVAIKTGGGLLVMAWIVLLVAALAQLWICVLAVRTLRHLSLSPVFFEWKTLRTLFRFGSLNLVQGVAKRASKSAGTIIVGVILGPALVTYYAISEALTNKSAELSGGISAVLMPVASQLDAEDRRNDLARAFLLASRTLLALALGVAIIFFTLGWPLIELWIGQGYAASTYPVLCVLALAMVVQMASTGAISILKGTNHVDLLAKTGLLSLVLTLTFGVIFVKLLGTVGMAYAMLLAQGVTGGVLIPLFACRTLDVSAGRFLGKGLVPGVVAACPGLIVAVTMASVSPPSRLIHVIVQVMCVALVTGVSVLFICFEKQLRSDILRSFVAGSGASPTQGIPVPGDQPRHLPEDAACEPVPPQDALAQGTSRR